MPKTPAFTPKPALAKVPLAARKDLRDKFESEEIMSEYKSKIKGFLGVDFTINVVGAEVWAYAKEDNFAMGSCFAGYIDGFIYSIERFVEKYGETGKQYFNEAVAQSEVTITVNPLGDKGEVISSDIKDGVYRILFRHDCLGYNQSQQSEYTVIEAIDNVPRESGFSLAAKHSIEEKYDEEIEEIQEAIDALVGCKVTLDPNWEENYAALSKLDNKKWHASFGESIFNYFKGLQWQLEQQGFKGDDLLQEGLQEVVETKTFKVRINPKTNGMNETLVEDGVVYMQCKAENFGYNASDMGYGLVKLL